jgi:hypothetical protein
MTTKNKEKIKELITQCKIYRFSTEESLNYLEENGYKISDRTLRRIKNEMNEHVSDRFIEIAKYEHVDETFRSLDTLKMIEKKYWQLLTQNPTINEQIKINNAICDIQGAILAMLQGVPTLEKMKEILDFRVAECEKYTKKASVA